MFKTSEREESTSREGGILAEQPMNPIWRGKESSGQLEKGIDHENQLRLANSV